MSRHAAKVRNLLVSESAAMKQVVSSIEEIAATDEPVLIEGEPGVGRELIARVIHFSSPRRSRELVSVRAGVAPKQLFVDEIEGSSNSPFNKAEGGTLLVKNLTELTRLAQRKLNRLLKPNQTDHDIRITATTDPDLESAVDAEVFNRQLFSRIGKTKIVVPPLRERAEDIAPLAASLIRHYGKEIGRRRIAVSTRAYDRMVMYPWPGNVAELKQITRRLVYRTKRSRIEAGDVDAILPMVAERVPLEDMSFEDMTRSKLTSFLRRVEGYPLDGFYDHVIKRVERPLLELVMEHTGHNQLKAAEILGLNRNTLRRKLCEHGMLETKGAQKRTRRKTVSKPAMAARKARK